ncbi:DUF2637 domain-containing protein [Nocardia sp. NPDC004582]
MPIHADFKDSPTQLSASDHTATSSPGGGAQTSSRAHVYFWCELATAAAISITGNAIHAALRAQALPLLAAAVAIVPPIELLAAVHAVTILLRAHAHTRLIHTLAILMTVLIAVAAFSLSFTALRDLAGTTGIPATQAWLWPLIIEGSMTQATVAILALARSPQPPTRTTSALHTASAPGTLSIPESHNGADANVVRTRPGSELDRRIATSEVPYAPHGSCPRVGGWAEVAAAICDRDPARRRDPAEVAIVLSKHFDQGQTPTQISHEIRRSRSTISRIISDAATLETKPHATYS